MQHTQSQRFVIYGPGRLSKEELTVAGEEAPEDYYLKLEDIRPQILRNKSTMVTVNRMNVESIMESIQMVEKLNGPIWLRALGKMTV